MNSWGSETIEELLNDLYEVGITKSLGYLPIKTLINICNKSINDIIKFSKANSLGYKVYTQNECSIGSGAIFVYHESMLMNILNANKRAFLKAGVPIDSAVNYVDYIAKENVCSTRYPKAYAVVGKTFNDFRFR